jgi:hypothetical protein
MLSACKADAPILHESLSLPLNGASRALVDIEMYSGVLIVSNGAQGLLDADFSLSNLYQFPKIGHRQDDRTAFLSIHQPERTSPFRQTRNDWTLRLTNEIPVTLNLRLSTGIYTLRLGGLHIAGLQIEISGPGVVVLDLVGFWEEDLDIIVRGNQGSALTITAPQGTGTRVESNGKIRKLSLGNFQQERNIYSNTAWGSSGPRLNILLEGSFSNLSLTSGFTRDLPVHIAIRIARDMFSQSEIFDCSVEPLYRLPQPNDTVRDLWFDFLCHRGPEHRALDGRDLLTQELAESELVDRIRRQFYAGEPLDEATLHFNIPEFLSATVDMMTIIQARQRYEFSITHFIGSFDYSVKREGSRVKFEIHNQTDRSSGTHIPLRFPEGGYTLSLEELEREKPALANAFLMEVIYSGKYPLISILAAKNRAETAPGEGGGNFTQTFIWTEHDLGLSELPPWPTYLDQIDVR